MTGQGFELRPNFALLWAKFSSICTKGAFKLIKLTFKLGFKPPKLMTITNKFTPLDKLSTTLHHASNLLLTVQKQILYTHIQFEAGLKGDLKHGLNAWFECQFYRIEPIRINRVFLSYGAFVRWGLHLRISAT